MEMKLRRLLIDELEKIEDESKNLENQIEPAYRSARASGDVTALANVERMRERYARRGQLSTLVTTNISIAEGWATDTDKKRDLQPEAKRNMGVRVEVSTTPS